MSKQKDQFIALLGELFQLNQPELDFGLYRILHARSAQIKDFIDTELGSEIDVHFAEQSQSNAHDSLEAARVKVAETLGEDAFLPMGVLKPEYRGTKVGKEFELAQQQARDGGGALADDAQVYEHLYRFFSRYYDKGDFMSKRYFVAENDSRAAPYAVPYHGGEVMLHWANKDQYYIKSSEALSNFTFDLNTAQAKEQGQQSGLDFQPAHATPLKVHFRLAAAAEGEHNNVKEGQERFFIIHASQALKLEVNEQGQTELVVQFDYHPDSEKSGQAGTWQQKRLAEAEQMVAEQLDNLVFPHPELRAFQELLFAPAPTDKQPNRTLLGKYLRQFTARNTMDYFIHKNLGGFLRRELDFYIKNEIIRLDDIEAADAPRVDEYLKKLRVLRKIARRIIDFLAQLEDFQKKLWLKKKFVVETQYCITLDRIPESFYPEIAANKKQHNAWLKLFNINLPATSNNTAETNNPITIEFLKNNKHLAIDTAFYSIEQRERILAQIENLDQNTSGILIHSENLQALNLAKTKFSELIDFIYIDPPYNTGGDGFPYKDAYQHSTWLSMLGDRLNAARSLQKPTSALFCSINDIEYTNASMCAKTVYGPQNILPPFIWKNKAGGGDDSDHVVTEHEYVLISAKNKEQLKLNRIQHESPAMTAKYNKSENGRRYYLERLDKTSLSYSKSMDYPIPAPDGTEIRPPQPDPLNPTTSWRWSFEKTKAERDKLVFKIDPRSGEWRIYTKTWEPDQRGVTPRSLLIEKEHGRNRDGTEEVDHILGPKKFKNPKPVRLIKHLINIGLRRKTGNIVLDFFAGSGTTAQSTIELNRLDNGQRKYFLIEGGAHFDSVLKPRIQRALHSQTWREGKPLSHDGVSHCLKYLRLESFEDTLNNLQLPDTPRLNISATDSGEMARDYFLKYWLEFETAGSPSLLNVREFSDPTLYKLKVKQPGSDAQVEKTIELVETFNWLIGLHVAHLDQPRRYAIELVRETDPELPQDQDTRWRATSIKEREDGEFWFRAVEGHVLRAPGDELSRERVLVIWRKLTGNSGRDQAALEAWLGKRGINPRESEFATIYVNGNHALPSDGEAAMRVRLIEEAFAQRMWEDV